MDLTNDSILWKKTIIGYHFTNNRLRDGRPLPKKDVWLKHQGAVTLCVSGFHMSVHPADALRFATGKHLLHRVELRGDLHFSPNRDKVVGRERRILATIDATPVIEYFFRMCVLAACDTTTMGVTTPDYVLDWAMTGKVSPAANRYFQDPANSFTRFVCLIRQWLRGDVGEGTFLKRMEWECDSTEWRELRALFKTLVKEQFHLTK